MLLEISTGEKKLKVTTFAFMHSKPNCVFVHYGNLSIPLVANIDHTLLLSVAGHIEGNEACPGARVGGNMKSTPTGTGHI